MTRTSFLSSETISNNILEESHHEQDEASPDKVDLGLMGLCTLQDVHAEISQCDSQEHQILRELHKLAETKSSIVPKQIIQSKE
jgi:hypothetical protein